jgi:hypothetical protein
LRTPTRRNAYDLRRSNETSEPSDQPGEGNPHLGRAIVSMPMPLLSPRTVRWLPSVVLGGFGLFAVIALGVLYKLHDMDNTTNASTVTTASAEDAQTKTVSAEAAAVAPTLAFNTVPSEVAALPPTSASEIPAQVSAPAVAEAPVSIASTPVPPPLPATERGTAPLPLLVEASAKAQPQTEPKKSTNRTVAAKTVPEQSSRRATVGRYAVAASESTPGSSHAPTAAANRLRAPQVDMPVSVVATNAGSAPVSQPAQEQPARHSVIDDRIAASLVSRFSQAYANGDTERLMQLFTQDAQNGSGDRHAIAEDYRHLFEASERRRIALRDLSWLTVGDGATIIASFETEVVPRGKSHGEHATGDIRFDLREEDGELRIYRLSHDNRRI